MPSSRRSFLARLGQAIGLVALAGCDRLSSSPWFIRLLDTAYLSGGFGEPPEGVQRRFSDGTADAWAERVQDLEDAGAAIHSVRAVPDDQHDNDDCLSRALQRCATRGVHLHHWNVRCGHVEHARRRARSTASVCNRHGTAID